MQDVVSDFVVRINNAVNVGKKDVTVLKNKMVVNICKWLVTEDLLYSFEDLENGYLRVELNLNKLRWLKRRSSPGQREYFSYRDLSKYPAQDKGYLVLSTSDPSNPVISTYRLVKENIKLGGELILQVHVN
jgi:ribosomal protein S8